MLGDNEKIAICQDNQERRKGGGGEEEVNVWICKVWVYLICGIGLGLGNRMRMKEVKNGLKTSCY